MFNIINGRFSDSAHDCNCLKLCESEESEIRVLSTLKDLYEIVRDSDRLVTF